MTPRGIVIVLAIGITLIGCVSEQEQRRQAEATYQANCRAEIEHLNRTVGDPWDRRIAQDDVIVHCFPEKARLAAALTAYSRAAQAAVREGTILDEDAWAGFQKYLRSLDREYQPAELQLEAIRIQTAAQDLTELGTRKGLSRRTIPPGAAYQSTSVPRISQ
jgi:hypothetical protein